MSGYPLSLPSQEKKIVEKINNYIAGHGLSANDFEWVETYSKFTANRRVREITYIPLKYYYTFDYSPPLIIPKPEQFHSFFSPGKDTVHDSKVFDSWAAQLKHVRSWFGYLSREIESINFLEKIAADGSVSFGRVSLQTDNEPFTNNQVERILKVTEGLKKDFEKLKEKGEINDDQLEYAKGQLDFLIENVKKQGKRAWITMALGVVIQLVFSNIDTSLLNRFWAALQTAIGEALILLPNIPRSLTG